MDAPEYPKIETLFERDPVTFKADPTKLRSPVHGTINKWEVTEKIDGMNIRVSLSRGGEVSFGGRTNNAQLPANLVEYLIKTFTAEKMKAVARNGGDELTKVVLYGEGYGAGIQKGGGYRQDQSFVLFDVLAGGSLQWLERPALLCIANSLGIDVVPLLGVMSLEQIVQLVSIPFSSRLGDGQAQAEGIVARPIETLFDRRGRRIIIKLKTRDLEGYQPPSKSSSSSSPSSSSSGPEKAVAQDGEGSS